MKKIFLFISLTLPFLSFSQSSLDSGLVAYYKFDGNFADSSGNNNNGFNVGSQFGNDRKGQPNKAATFNGTSSYVLVAASKSLNSIKNNISASMWVYVNDWFTWAEFKYAPLFCKSQLNNTTQYRFTLLDNAFDVISNGKKFYRLTPTSTLNKGTWYHVAIISKNDSCSFYVNGVFVQSTHNEAPYPSDTTQPLEIGRDYAGSIDYFNGTMDELRLYNRTLTSTEILNLYNGPNTSIIKTSLSKQNFNIFPNPSTGIINFEINDFEVSKVEIINSFGAIIYSNKFSETIDLKYISKGIYFIKLFDKENFVLNSKLIIE